MSHFCVCVSPTSFPRYMASAGLDRKLRVFDLRTYRVLQELVLPQGAGHLAFSQRGVLAAACGDLVQVGPPPLNPPLICSSPMTSLNVCPPKKTKVYKDVGKEVPPQPYLCHRPPRPPHGLRFCPFEDVLGAGHGHGFTSILVPGRVAPTQGCQKRGGGGGMFPDNPHTCYPPTAAV